MKLTVVLPSAGKGTRLNLPYPKEILRLDNDNALIDNCFNFFKDYGRNQVEFIVQLIEIILIYILTYGKNKQAKSILN